MPDLRLADLLTALSVTTDLAMGQSRELAIRSCVVATAIARSIGLPEAEVSVVYYTTLLKHLGCTATSRGDPALRSRRAGDAPGRGADRPLQPEGGARVPARGGEGRGRRACRTRRESRDRRRGDGPRHHRGGLRGRRAHGGPVATGRGRPASTEREPRTLGRQADRAAFGPTISPSPRGSPSRRGRPCSSTHPRERRRRSRWSAADPEAGSIRRWQMPSRWWAPTSSGASKPGIRGPLSLPRNRAGPADRGSARAARPSVRGLRRPQDAVHAGPLVRGGRGRGDGGNAADFRTPSGSCSPVSCTTSAGPA